MSERKVNKRRQALAFDMPDIPNKLYFSIGEVARYCDLKTHVLRYWENEFEKLAPVKRRGNHRYYSQSDIHLIMTIKHLLYCDGFTIEGARAQLKHKKIEQLPLPNQTTVTPAVVAEKQNRYMPLLSAKIEKPTIATTLAELERALDLFEEKDHA